MRRLLPLLGAVLALAAAGNASADTFRVVHKHASRSTPSSSAIPFANAQSGGPHSFAALRGLWQAAGARYGIPWQVLAAINKVETDFGRNLGPSSAGAVGWMQFMPSTWARWGLDANGDGIADPDNPVDAIFSAARYLAGCGGQFDIARAVDCYNHSQAYVSEVLQLAAQFDQGGLGGAAFGPGLFSVDLQPQLASARSRVAASKTQLSAARARAGKLAGAERRLLRAASSAHLLSDQLEAQKHAVLLRVRRDAAQARANQLQKVLDAADARVSRLQDQINNPTFATGLSSFGGDSGVVSTAAQYLGVPYVWAGATPSGFDCSGLVQYVFAQVGISLPHNTVAQWHSPQAVSVPRNQLQPGDLVFFNRLDHVGIYIGNGYLIDAPHTGTDVRIDNLREGWYAARYDGAKRIVGAQIGGVPQAGAAMTFASGRGATTFTSDVVYFTH